MARAWTATEKPQRLTVPAGTGTVVTMLESVVINPRFRGPPDSANGGYACAMAAQSIAGPAEVTLHAPPPLGQPLKIRQDHENVILLEGDQVVATARPSAIEHNVPDPIGVAEASRASARYEWIDDHPYPTCFVCGPQRGEGDGLRIFPGPVDDKPLYAAPWTPDPSLTDPGGHVRPEFVWAALDCPSGIVTDLFGDVGLILLGRLAVDVRRPLPALSPYVVTSWPLDRDGRKLHTGSALFSSDGNLHALARATWIEVRSSV